MSINFFQGLLYGFISGITEFLPISSQAHQALLLRMFGMSQRDPVLDFVVHGVLLTVLFYAVNNTINQMKRSRAGGARYDRHGSASVMSLYLIRKAALPLVLAMLLLFYILKGNDNLLYTAVFLLINGLILFLPSRLTQGNKDARSMSQLDSVLLGIFGAFGTISGISRIAATTSFLIGRGADRQHALNWSLMLGVYALVLLVGYDLVAIFTSIMQIPLWSNFFSYVSAAAGAFCGGNIGIRFIRALIKQSSLSNFAFYSWGLALLTFFIYLTVV